ncbi:MAG: glycoside hydrolase family 97 protein [Bacteroidota bacterium]
MNLSSFLHTAGSLLVLLLIYGTLTAQPISLNSPNQRLSVEVSISDNISWKVSLNDATVIEQAQISMDMGNGRVLGMKPKLKKKKTESLTEEIHVAVPNKDALINSSYNQLSMRFKGDYQVIFRAYDDGISYRFVDEDKESTIVLNEEMGLTFSDNASTYFPWEESMYSHNERLYNHTDITQLKNGDFCSLPVMFESGKTKVLFTEASLHNYPCMFLAKGEGNTMTSTFPKYVLEAEPNKDFWPDRNQTITKEADYIAKVSGERAYPWRVFIISDDDRTFVESNLVTQLSGTSKIEDPSWIKPGKVAWDWWNANNIYGVDFRAGINQETYKYYIDFASKNNIEYIILDEGWTKSTTEIYESNDELDIPELVKYGKSKNVDIILWVLWKPLNDDPEGLIKLYSGWGAAGIKVDFMQRSDQYVVQSYEVIAEIAARYQFLVDYHGAFKPAGIERVWPNLVSYEGVMGNEQNKWEVSQFDYSKTPFPVNPEHNVTIPFIRMAAGPMDFTPGSMTNLNRVDFTSLGTPDSEVQSNMTAFFSRPMTLGSRAHQVAMYVVFESPVQMMCESPTIYYKEQETVDFITQIPTTWDETVVLEAAVADYIVLARRKGDSWYLGAMTDWTAREFDIELSFLGEGEYDMQVFKDGVNTDRNAMDYKFEQTTVQKESKVHMSLSSGGGYSAIITKK